MKSYYKSIFCLSVLLFIFLIINPQNTVASEGSKEILTVAFPEAPGINQSHEDGTYSGIVYDWLMEISKYTGWEYEFITGDASELLDGMMDGKYDLMGAMYYMEHLKQFFHYPDYSMGSNYYLLVSKKENESVKSFDLTTINGKKIGVFKNSKDKIQRLNYFLSFNNLSCELVYYDNVEDYQASLDNSEVDLLLTSDVNLDETHNVAVKFEGAPYYIVTNINKKYLCDELNKALRQIYAANPNFSEELYNKYYPDYYTNSINLSEEDKLYIQKSEPVKVVFLKNRYPLIYQNNDSFFGISLDIFDLITEKTNLQFEYLHASTYQECMEMLKQGEADLMGNFLDDEYYAKNLDLALTKHYVSLDNVILKNKKVPFPSDNSKLALVQGRAVPKNEDSANIVYYSTSQQCVNSVNAGETDYTYLPSSYLEDLLLKGNYTNVSIVAFNTPETTVSIALPKPVNASLYSVLSKALYSISDNEADKIISKNLVSIGTNKITLKSLIYSNPITYIVTLTLFLIMISTIFILYAKSKLNNKLMELKLVEAEEAGRVKTEFLSRMSHEIRTPMNAIIGLVNLCLMSKDSTPALKTDLEKINVSAQFLLALVNDILDMSKIDSKKMNIVEKPFYPKTILDQLQNIVEIQANELEIKISAECEVNSKILIGDPIRIRQVLTNLLSNSLKFTNKGGHIILSIKELSCDEKTAEVRFSVKDDGIGIKPKDLGRIFNSFEQADYINQALPGTGLGIPISNNLVKLMGGKLNVISEPDKGTEFYFILQLPVGEAIETEEAAKNHEVEDAPPQLNGMRILLAEDNELNAEIVTKLLEMQEVFVELAVNGQEAVDLYASHTPGYYDLILMDIQMPVKNGLEAAIEIRSLENNTDRKIPIIAMTANTFKEDQEEAAASGMNDFIPKPFDIKQFYLILKKSRSL